MSRIQWEKFKPVQIAQNYNDGVIKLYEKTQEVDKYNTPIRGRYTEQEVYKDWFRRLGVTVQDTYYSSADKMKVTEKVAIKGNVVIDSQWSAKINQKQYEVYRVYFNGETQETEISLSEVVQNYIKRKDS